VSERGTLLLEYSTRVQKVIGSILGSGQRLNHWHLLFP